LREASGELGYQNNAGDGRSNDGREKSGHTDNDTRRNTQVQVWKQERANGREQQTSLRANR
jgi:hypothetical protein